MSTPGTSVLRDEYGKEIHNGAEKAPNIPVSSQPLMQRFFESKQEEKVKWADDSDNGNSSGEGDDEDISDIEIVSPKHQSKFIIHESEYPDEETKQDCECKIFMGDDIETPLALLKMYCEEELFEPILCICNNIVSCYNHIFSVSRDIFSEHRVAFVDLFFRLRHEMLFRYVCLTINQPPTLSDRKFSEWGIPSNRTPDLILEVENALIILEITAQSSLEKAAVSKGIEILGFESKYKKEIDMLIDMGHNVHYCPIFFDMSQPDKPLYIDSWEFLQEHFNINKFYEQQLKMISKYMAVITNDMKHAISFAATINFVKTEKIEPNHPQHNFLYNIGYNSKSKPEYLYLKVNPHVYSKIVNNWDRLPMILERSGFLDNQRVSILISTVSHRIKICIDEKGDTIPNLINFINQNDKTNILKHVYLQVGNKKIKCIDVDSGVSIIEKSKGRSNLDTDFEQVRKFIEHNPTYISLDKIDLSIYLEKCSNFKAQQINCSIYDEFYEDRIINSIIEFDYKHDMIKNNSQNSELPFSKGKLLGQMKSSDIDIVKVMQDIESVYYNANLDLGELPRKIMKMKSPFLLPLSAINSSNYCKLEFKNISFINNVICKLTDQPFTTRILNMVLSEEYKMYTKPNLISSTLQSLINQRQSCSNEINYLFKKTKRDHPEVKNIKSIKEGPVYEELKNIRNRLNALNKEIKNREKIEDIGKDISYVRIPSKKKGSLFHNEFLIEMEHFKDKKSQSTIEGFGIYSTIQEDMDFDQEIFNNICSDLPMNCGTNPDSFMHNYVADDNRLFKELKIKTLENYNQLYENIKNSCLGHASTLVSRLGHSLMFYSQQAFSSDQIRVDNLGYNNVLLIVRGGKKIFSTKKSKFFRLVYPILESAIPWYIYGHENKGSINIMEIDGVKYNLTPWAFLHEDILTDSISFYHRVCSFALLNLNPKISLSMQFSQIQLNVLLAFHNRRQTETLLANMRYILLSTLGDFTGIQEILPDFFGFNYDRFQAFIRNCIFVKYPEYFKSIQIIKTNKEKNLNESMLMSSGLKNIFTNNIITKSSDLVMMIYSTFLMTKAPYQKLIERSANLKGILKIHQQYDETVGLELTPEGQFHKLNVECNNDLLEYSGNLFNNDFSFDAKYCANIGVFMNSYFKSQGLTESIHHEWVKIINMSWDELSTSTGLRGRYGEVEDFWGKKGYFVVYKIILKDEEFRTTLKNLLLSELSDDDKRKILRNINKIYIQQETENEFLIFHAVDKKQWRGGREIYVMEVETKLLQQPIEKFMGYICDKIDTELISIPSNKRSQIIHHAIFEKDLPLKELLTWYLTLDCSKWAPKSIFSKFAIVLNNMDCIPNSFKIHFMNYIEKLYQKRLYFNVGEVEILKNNILYTEIVNKYLKFDEKVKGYYMLVPYSWVMGIFNYTSSFLHAANQKYFSYLLNKATLISYREDVSMVMYAHSDDSGGRLSVPDESHLQRALVLYEINLHACNHLLSRKKSVVSRIYFEILSIIYMFKQLLALLPKFLGGIRFLPTDKGVSQDLLQSYSKSIEVLTAGADFSVSYLVMKIVSHMVFRFYFHKDPKPIDYEIPVQYMGMPDAHPLMVLLCGSDSDLLRLMELPGGKDNLVKQLSYMNALGAQGIGEGPVKPLKFLIKIKNLNKDFKQHLENFSEVLDKWSIGNINYHNTGMNALSFLKKLNDPGFVGSLVNESLTRRISRAYYISYAPTAITGLGNLKISKLIDGLKIFLSANDINSSVRQILQDVLSEEDLTKVFNEINYQEERSRLFIDILEKTMAAPRKINEYLGKLSMENRKLNRTHKTLKPTLIQITRGLTIFSNVPDPASLVSFIKEPELRWALPNVRNIHSAKDELQNYLLSLGYDITTIPADILLRICRVFGPDNVKSFYLYSRVPGEMRQIKTYSSLLTYLSINSFEGNEIEGLTVKMSHRDVAKGYIGTYLSDEIYFVNNIISLLMLLINKCDKNFVSTLTINPISDIHFTGGTVEELLIKCKDFIDDNPEGKFCNLQLSCLNDIINNTNLTNIDDNAYYFFTKAQKSRHGWFGKGELFIRIKSDFYLLTLLNNEITYVLTNVVGKINPINEKFLFDIFNNLDLKIPKKFPKNIKYNELYFGFDSAGGLSVLTSRELERGVPCRSGATAGGVTEFFKYAKVVNIIRDVVIIEYDNMGKIETNKIYFLPIKKVEILGLLRGMLTPSDFTDKLITMGLNDFEEFIATELMPEYGSELYANFTQVFDYYSASRMYSIFRDSVSKGFSKLPTSFSTGSLPAEEGSLVRILIEYNNQTSDKIIKNINYIDSDIMRLRSEFPEQVTTIFTENLIKNYDRIYNKTEQKEITEYYHKILSGEDIEQKRDGLIKLMTHWGYATLVNALENFKMLKTPDNFVYFNLHNCSNNPYIMQYIIDFVKTLVSTMAEFEPTIIKEDLIYQSNLLNISITDAFKNMIIDLALQTYSAQNPLNFPLLSFGIFYNKLIALLKNDEFNLQLEKNLSLNTYFSCLPFNFQNRVNIIHLINTILYCWSINIKKLNKGSFFPDILVKLQRLPDNFMPILTLVKQFNVKMSPAEIYHWGVLNNNVLSYILNTNEIWIPNKVFRLNNKFKNLSKEPIRLTNLISFKRPLSNNTLEHENWDEIQYELSMTEIDEDTILELWSEIENPYVKKQTGVKKFKNFDSVYAPITWVMAFGRSGWLNIFNYVRQLGENLIILTDQINESYKNLQNSGYRIVDYSRRLGMKSHPIIAYYSFQKELNNPQFINKLLSSDTTNISDYRETNQLDVVRDSNGKTKRINNLGTRLLGKEWTSSGAKSVLINDTVQLLFPGDEGYDNSDDNQLSTINPDDNVDRFTELMKDAAQKLNLDQSTTDSITEKYAAKCLEGMSTEQLFKSAVSESVLTNLNKEISQGEASLSKEQIIKMLQNPVHFGLTYTASKTDKDPITDKKLKSEINSIHPELANLVASGTLTISDKFHNILGANYKIWYNMAKHTDHKNENKKFLLQVILSICKNSIKVISNETDNMWSEIIHNCTMYFAQTLPDSDDDDIFDGIYNVLPGARIIYGIQGA